MDKLKVFKIDENRIYIGHAGKEDGIERTFQEIEQISEMILCLKRAFLLENSNYGMTSHAHSYKNVLEKVGAI